MNRTNLQSIFKKYIDNFEILNNEKNDETYKWEIAQEFQKFDVDAEDFVEMLTHMWKVSENLIDSSQQLPFYALVEFARKEPETVREMFRKLFAEEHLGDIEKQAVIDEFIASSEELRKKYYPDSRLYTNNQRSVMMYLFLRYPNSNYGYKASQAKSFADCIEFYEDWGPMTDFRLDIFSRMCEQLIEEIKKNDALMETHMSRFENTTRKLHPDENLHILTLDIIYSSQAYNFYGDMTFDPINAKSRKLYFERVAKAKELAEAVEKAKADAALLDEAKAYIAASLTKGLTVKHRVFGEGVIEECTGTIIAVHFAKTDETKKLGLTVAIGNGLISLPSEEMAQKIKEYIPVLNRETQIPGNLSRAVDELQPYLEYLD